MEGGVSWGRDERSGCLADAYRTVYSHLSRYQI